MPIIRLKLNRRIQWTTATASNKKLALIASLIICGLAAVFVSILIIVGSKDPAVTVTDSQISIKSMYGLDIPLSDITGAELYEQSMNELDPGMRRTNGYGGFGDTLKGHFRSGKLEGFMLFVRAKSAPTILLERDGEDVYISFRDGEKTRALYDEILSTWS